VPRQIHIFDPPERFVVGTVGQPGERTFYMQAAGGSRVISVALEKAQVALLAEKLDELLDEVRRRGADVPARGALEPGETDDLDPLAMPIEEEFRVGTLGLSWDPGPGLVLVEARAVVSADELGENEPEGADDLDDDSPTGPDVLRVRIAPAAARAFSRRASKVVSAGRPPCPLCGLPLDPSGHFCPRMN
jgi:uncharacterized repeat protein (TIGR03847 family)